MRSSIVAVVMLILSVSLCSAGGNDISAHMCQRIAFKHQNHAALLYDFAILAHLVEIVPAVGVEAINQQRRAHDKAHLRLGHAGTQLQHHLGGDNIALLDIHLVRLDGGHIGRIGTAGDTE